MKLFVVIQMKGKLYPKKHGHWYGYAYGHSDFQKIKIWTWQGYEKNIFIYYVHAYNIHKQSKLMETNSNQCKKTLNLHD